jgi:enoyl-CoA hydratase/carnithine racemase
VTTGEDELLHERHGEVLVLTLNRPQARNALTPAMLIGLGTAIVEAETDPDIRAVVLTGAGDRAFCVGMDLRSFAGGDDDNRSYAGDAMVAYHRIMNGEISVPLIGATNATALAGGLELLLGCDVIVASSAAEFGLPEVKRGLFPGGSGTSIGRRMPLGLALEMTLTGDSITAARAFEVGLVNAVVAPDEVLPTAISYAERIAANAPLGVAAVKELVRLAITDAGRASTRLDDWRQIVFQSEDAREGATAFVEKRPPVWQGR